MPGRIPRDVQVSGPERLSGLLVLILTLTTVMALGSTRRGGLIRAGVQHNNNCSNGLSPGTHGVPDERADS